MSQGARSNGTGVIALLGVIITLVLLIAGLAGDGEEFLIVAATVAAVTGVLTIIGIAMRAVRYVQSNPQQRQLPPPRVPKLLPRAIRRQRMPSPQSAASAPMQGLAGAEAALANLLGQLRASNADPSWIAYAWQVASHAATEFRAVASKLESVEWSIAHTPVSQRPTLHDGVMRLRKWLDEGLEAYQGMVAAAGKMLIASTPASVAGELTEAADRLASVAQALTELSEQYSWLQNR